MSGLEGKKLSRYELQRLVGRGGMADVYEAYDPRFDRKVAIKVFKRDDEAMLNRFIREAQLMARLNNKHLVMVYDSGQSDIDGVPWYYIIMPFMEGGTLRARIRRSRLSLAEACNSLKDIAVALDYIHSQGIIHRDIKSSNVLLGADGTCYLSDFGIARMTSDMTKLTSTGNVLGTVDYVAPELFEVNRKADARSDLYSLGVLLFEMVTGQLPFSADNQIALVAMHVNKRPPSPRSINQDIPAQVEKVILKALEKKPEQRYATATELADAFCKAVTASSKNANQDRNNAVKRGQTDYIDPFVAGNPRIQQPPQMPKISSTPQQQIRLAPLAGSTETPPYIPPAQPDPAPMPEAGKTPSISPTQRRPRTLIITLVALLVLFLVTIPLIYFTVFSNNGKLLTGTPTTQVSASTTSGTKLTPTNTPDTTATALAGLTATAQAQANATATVVAGVTATAQAQASATAGVIQTAVAVPAFYDDPLTDGTSTKTQNAGWTQDNFCAFGKAGYHVTQYEFNNKHACPETKDLGSNITISVDINIKSGHSGGVLFRFNTTLLGGYRAYFFEIDNAGRYKVSLLTDTDQTDLKSWTASSVIKVGNNVSNTVQLKIVGSTFLLYANGQFLSTVTDSSNTYPAGQIAFAAVATDAITEVIYTNLKVYPAS